MSKKHRPVPAIEDKPLPAIQKRRGSKHSPSLAEFVTLCIQAKRREEAWKRRLEEQEALERRKHRPVSKYEKLPSDPLPKLRKRRPSQAMEDVVNSKIEAMRLAEENRRQQEEERQRGQAGQELDSRQGAVNPAPTAIQLKAARRMVRIINRIAAAKRTEDQTRQQRDATESESDSGGSSSAGYFEQGPSLVSHTRQYSGSTHGQDISSRYHRRKTSVPELAMQRIPDMKSVTPRDDWRRQTSNTRCQEQQRSPEHGILPRGNMGKNSRRQTIRLLDESPTTRQNSDSDSLPPI